MFEIFVNSKYSFAVWVYSILLLLVPFLGYLAQRSRKKAGFYFLLGISYFILWYWYALSRAGEDYDAYIRHFNYCDSISACFSDTGIELGYSLLNYCIFLFTSNPVYGIVIIKTIQLTLFFSLVCKLRKNASIPMLLTIYIATMYVQSYNVIRMCLAWTVVAHSYYYLISHPKKSFVVAIIALFIHRSSIFYFLYVVYFILIKQGLKRFSPIVLLLGSAVLSIIVVMFTIQYGVEIIMSGLGDGRYNSYLNEISEGGSIGFGVIAMSVPQFLLLLYTRRKMTGNQYGKTFWLVSLIGVIIGTAVYILGYQLFIISRAQYYYVCPIMLYMACLTYRLKKKYWLKTSIYCYWYFRYILALNLLVLDAGVEKIIFIWD